MKLSFAACAFLSILTFATLARAEWSVNADLTHYQWKEKASPEVKITGWQPGIGVTRTDEPEYGWGMRYHGALYASSLKYQSGDVFSDTIHYAGIVNELNALYRPPDARVLQFVAGAGLDYWKRQSSLTGPGRQEQDWKVIFLRFGVHGGSSRGWYAGGGVKYPIFTEEWAHLQDLGYDQSPRINPKGNFSIYASLGYRVSSHWNVGGYYESYRFAQSPAVSVRLRGVPATVQQPQSKQDVFGTRLEYVF